MGQRPSSGNNRDNDKGKGYKKDGGSSAGRSFKKQDDSRGGKGPYRASGDDRGKKSFDKPARFSKDDKPSGGYKRSEGGEEKRSFRGEGGFKRSEDRGGEKRPYKRDDKPGGFKRTEDRDSEKRPYRGERSEGGFKRSDDRGEKRPYKREDKPGGYKRSEDRDSEKRPYRSDRPEGGFKRSDDRGEKRPYKKDDKPGGYKRSEDRDGEKRPYRSEEGREKRSFDRPDGERKRFDDRGDKKPSFRKDDGEKRSYGKDRGERSGEDRPYKKPFKKDDAAKDGEDKPRRSNRFEDKDLSFGRASARKQEEEKQKERAEKKQKNFNEEDSYGEEVKLEPKVIKKAEPEDFTQAFPLGARKVSGPFRKKFEEEQEAEKKGIKRERKPRKKEDDAEDEIKEMTLNKYISHSGECSRREAAEMVKQGKVKVNGELALDPGYRVQPYDQVTIAGKKLTPQKGRVYVLLNKPKGFITTTEDPEGRKTVMDLVANASEGRMYPVGRLDRNTTGLLLLTNDGDLAQKLSHPSYEIKKVYQVSLNKPLTKADFEKIVGGLELEDGPVHVDALSYLDSKDELGIEIHNGRNRIVRRIFESLGYEVDKLDRVMYAGLTKKNLPRGKWRFLDEKEIIILKHFKGS